MFIKSKIMRDTALLTIMQLFLDSSALLLNVFITRQLGSSAMGILTLTGSFLNLAGIISNGSAFLCTSRLISEELGKPSSNPDQVLFHGIKLCMILSLTVSAIIITFAQPFSSSFFNDPGMARDIRLMPAALISGAIACCFKGYFNACRHSSIAASGDVLEFIVKSAVIVMLTLTASSASESTVCGIMISGIIAGNIFSMVYLLAVYSRLRVHSSGRSTLTFRKYTSYAFPIMGGAILTSVLSSTNDALIPFCLRQYGDSSADALSMFGIFEAIVIPTLFFPSVVLCSMSGMIVSESARASAAGNRERIRSLASRLTEWTMIYAVFAAAVLMRFGVPIGRLLGSSDAGHMIRVIAPVVPFIYMEIILEAMIKGMGMQAFSSLNYLAEYAIRISVVLVFVPLTGFYGIAASYYASNVIGNCSRFIKLLKASDMKFRPLRTIAVPIFYAALTMSAAELLTRITGTGGESVPAMIFFTAIWGAVYFTFFGLMGKIKPFDIKYKLKIVQNQQ